MRALLSVLVVLCAFAPASLASAQVELDGSAVDPIDGDETCLFHDDFDGVGSPDEGLWEPVGTPATSLVGDGKLTVVVDGATDLADDGPYSLHQGVRSRVAFGPGTTFEAVSEYVASNQHTLMLGVSVQPEVYLGEASEESLLVYGGTTSYPTRLLIQTFDGVQPQWTPGGSQPSAGFHVWRIEWPVHGPARFYLDGAIQAEHDVRPNIGGLHVHLGGDGHTPLYEVQYDEVSVWSGAGGEDPCPGGDPGGGNTLEIGPQALPLPFQEVGFGGANVALDCARPLIEIGDVELRGLVETSITPPHPSEPPALRDARCALT